MDIKKCNDDICEHLPIFYFSLLGQGRAHHPRHVHQRRRCDRLLLRVAEESQPRVLRPAHLQVRAGIQLSPPQIRPGTHAQPAMMCSKGQHCYLRSLKEYSFFRKNLA